MSQEMKLLTGHIHSCPPTGVSITGRMNASFHFQAPLYLTMLYIQIKI